MTTMKRTKFPEKRHIQAIKEHENGKGSITADL